MNTVGAKVNSTQDDIGRSSSSIAVLLLAGLVAFVLSILTVAGATAGRLASTLESRLVGQVTVLVWGQGLESADAAAARVAELLAGQAGVRHATVLEAADSDATVGEFTAGRLLGADGPRVVSVAGAPTSIPSTINLRSLLRTNQLTTAIDDHRGGRGPLETRVVLATGAGIVLGLALVGGLFAICLRAGVGVVGAASARFDLMTRLGADPVLIGAMVGRRLSVMALVGGVVGTTTADLLLFATTWAQGLWQGLGAAALAPQVRDGAWTAVCPIAVVAIAAVAGGLGATRAMAVRERGI